MSAGSQEPDDITSGITFTRQSAHLWSRQQIRQFRESIGAAETLRNNLRHDIDTARERQKAARIQSRLRSLSLQELARRGKNIKWSPLLAKGIRTAWDVLQAGPDGLQNSTTNVGAYSANQLFSLAQQAAQPQTTDLRPPKDTAKWTPEDFDLARALQAFASIGSLFSLPHVAALQQFLLALRWLYRSTRRWRWLFSTSSMKEGARAHHDELVARHASGQPSLAHDDVVERIGRARTLAGPTSRPEEVASRWKSAAAQLYPLLEALIADSGSPDDRRLLAAGLSITGLSRAVVQRIDGLQLDTRLLVRALRMYQDFGAKFALVVQRALLGDEMGLGKTIQALAAIAHTMSSEGQARHVVLCPAALIDNWLAEITKTMPTVAKWRFDGSERATAYRNWHSHGGILLTSYDQAGHLLDADPPRFGFLIVDEAHYVKNPKSKRSERATRLTKYAQRVLLMGGTLLENRANELIELVNLADPERGQQLRAVFGDGRDAHQRPDLFRRELSDIYLRRNKGEVLEELPELLKADIPVSISPKDNVAYVDAIKLRKLAQARIALAVGDGTRSPKMRVLDEIVDDCRAEGNRMLIFTEFRSVLDTAAQVVGEDCEVVHGDVPQAKRNDIIERFQATGGFAALVMQIRVGGVGLNLQAASVVVLLEPQYKPSTEEQAIGRAHRLGQDRAVTAYRLVAQDTVEDRIVALTAFKEDLFDELAGRSDLAESSPRAHDSQITDDQLLDDEWRRLGLDDPPDDPE